MFWKITTVVIVLALTVILLLVGWTDFSQREEMIIQNIKEVINIADQIVKIMEPVWASRKPAGAGETSFAGAAECHKYMQRMRMLLKNQQNLLEDNSYLNAVFNNRYRLLLSAIRAEKKLVDLVTNPVADAEEFHRNLKRLQEECLKDIQ